MEPQRKRQRYTEPIINLVDYHEVKVKIPKTLHNETFTIDDDNKDDAWSQIPTIYDLDDISEDELPVASTSKAQDKPQKSVIEFAKKPKTSSVNKSVKHLENFDDVIISIVSSDDEDSSEDRARQAQKVPSNESTSRFARPSSQNAANLDISIAATVLEDYENDDIMNISSSSQEGRSSSQKPNTSHIGSQSQVNSPKRPTVQEIFDEFIRENNVTLSNAGEMLTNVIGDGNDDGDDDTDSMKDFIDYGDDDDETAETPRNSESADNSSTDQIDFIFTESNFDEFNWCITRLINYDFILCQIPTLFKRLCKVFNRKYKKRERDEMIDKAVCTLKTKRDIIYTTRFNTRMTAIMGFEFNYDRLMNMA